MLIKFKKGLDLPIGGVPRQVIGDPIVSNHVALLGDDYPGLKPEIIVNTGESVKLGQTLFTDRRTGVKYVAPASGIISEINRGHKRTLKSVIIRIEGDDEVKHQAYSRSQMAALSSAEIKHHLLETGLWAAFRTRPFNKNPDPATAPHSLFVTAMDTQPLAANPDIIINTYTDEFLDGLTVLSRLFNVSIYVCSSDGSKVPVPENQWLKNVQFRGPHPAGLVGTHIHSLDPVSDMKTVWHLNYQDVIAIGSTFKSGHLWTTRIISLAGPSVQNPRLIPMTSGVALAEIVTGELQEGKHRIISGSVLSGRKGNETTSFLGRYHLQVSVLEELRSAIPAKQTVLHNRFSIHSLFPGWTMGLKDNYCFDTAQNGEERPLIPLVGFERVMPLDILPTPLLKSLLNSDFELAAALGCLELDEEDLALCEYVCCSKKDYMSPLRTCLNALDSQHP